MLKGAVKETALLESLHTKKTGRQDHKAGYRTSSSGKPAGTTSGVNMRDALDVGEIRTLVVSVLQVESCATNVERKVIASPTVF